MQQDLFLGFYQTQMPFADLNGENVRVRGWRSSLAPGPRRYIINEALNNAHGLSRGRFDIYHPTHHRLVPFVSARRIVVTHHDCTQEKFPADFRYHDRIMRAKKRLYARADAIICISEASRRDLLHYYPVDPAKTRVVHHGLSRLARPQHAPAGLPERDFVLYVGWRAGYKNFHGLLHAFRDSGLYQSMDLVVLGGGPISLDDERLISDLGLSSAIVLIPRVNDALLAEAYARARLLAYPSLFEGFGLPPLEAMYLG
ncbi:MAG: glycosyltransferase family 1 protein, partial [Candidatus Korobacteraceae bacterium]